MIEKRKPGLTGTTGGVRSIGQLANLLRANFAPSSTVQPPGATTTAIARQAARPAQTYVTPLVAGAATWTFSQPFTSKPSVQVTVEGAPSAGTPSTYIVLLQNAAQQYSGVQVHSTLTTDKRIVHITATGNPN